MQPHTYLNLCWSEAWNCLFFCFVVHNSNRSIEIAKKIKKRSCNKRNRETKKRITQFTHHIYLSQFIIVAAAGCSPCSLCACMSSVSSVCVCMSMILKSVSFMKNPSENIVHATSFIGICIHWTITECDVIYRANGYNEAN